MRSRCVALKITIAQTSYANHEREILQGLSRKSDALEGQAHVLELLDSFEVHGPNGAHDVLVTDVLIPATVIRNLKFMHPKRTAYHILLGLAYLHQEGVVHGGE